VIPRSKVSWKNCKRVQNFRFSLEYSGNTSINRNGRTAISFETFSILAEVYTEFGRFGLEAIEKDHSHLLKFQGILETL
jgi:hypothetical protein